jgi:DNA replication initiation complex subunit (GINS family)
MENNIMDVLYDLKIKEKNSKKLSKIPENFYDTVKKEIIALRNEIQDSFLKQEKEKYGNLLKKQAALENVYKELVKIRLEKVTAMILNNQFISEKTQITNLATEEQVFYEALQNFLETNKFYEPYATIKKVELPQVKEKIEIRKEKGNKESGSILLMILANRVVSDEQRDYNLHKGDVIYISRELGKLLIDSKIAEEISINL